VALVRVPTAPPPVRAALLLLAVMAVALHVLALAVPEKVFLKTAL
jgi:hypothetical protein